MWLKLNFEACVSLSKNECSNLLARSGEGQQLPQPKKWPHLHLLKTENRGHLSITIVFGIVTETKVWNTFLTSKHKTFQLVKFMSTFLNWSTNGICELILRVFEKLSFSGCSLVGGDITTFIRGKCENKEGFKSSNSRFDEQRLSLKAAKNRRQELSFKLC